MGQYDYYNHTNALEDQVDKARATLVYVHGGSVVGDGTNGFAFRKLFLETNRFWTRYDAYVRVLLSVIPKMTSTTESCDTRAKDQGCTKNGGGIVWGGDIDNLG